MGCVKPIILLSLEVIGLSADTWRAGAAQAVITPTEPIWMAGYGDRIHTSTGVLRGIYVKALALEAESGKPSVIVTADILDFPKEIPDAIAARCQKQFALPRDRLVLTRPIRTAPRLSTVTPFQCSIWKRASGRSSTATRHSWLKRPSA